MAMIKKLYILLTACLAAACAGQAPTTPEAPDTVSFDKKTVYISADAGQASATLTASASWQVKESPDWLGYVKPSSGDAGSTSMTFGGRFYSGSSDRSGIVRVSCGKSTAEITVIQRAVQHISLTPSAVNDFPAVGGSLTVKVEADFDYQVDLGGATWIRVGASLPRMGEVTFTIQTNEGDERKADVVFRDPATDYESILTVVQQGATLFLERKSLCEIYDATQGSEWANSKGWKSDSPVGSWYGVTTDSQGCVVELDLSGNNLKGQIPAAVINLKSLRKLYLYGNRLSGSLPSGMRLMEGWNGFSPQKYIYPQLDGNVLTSIDSEVVQYVKAGKDRGIDIVILGDGFTQSDLVLGKGFDAMVEKTISALFDIEPMKSDKDCFNVYAVSAESASRNIGTAAGNTAFGTYFTSGLGVTMDTDWKKVFSYAGKAPISDLTKTLVILLANTTRFGGCTLSWEDGSQISIIPDYPGGIENKYGFEGLVHHEAIGHGLGKLDEEYHYSGETAPASFADYLRGRHPIGLSLNISATSDPALVPWAELIGKPGCEKVGVFEGAYLYTYGAYRSEKDCCMDDNQPYFSTWCSYLIWKRIRSIVGENNTLNDYLSR